MSPIEQEVREMLRTKVAQAPVRDEPPPVVLRRTKTLRAVNGVGILAAAAAIVLGVVLGAQTFGDRSLEPIRPSDPVPWISEPASTVVPPREATATRPCAALDVAITGVLNDDLSLPSEMSFGPRGRDVFCVVDPHDAFEVILRGPDLQPLPLEVRVARSVRPFDVDSREPSVTRGLAVRWTNYCGPRAEGRTMNVVFEKSVLSIEDPWGVLPPCADAGEPSVLEFTGTTTSIVDDHLGPLPTTTDPLRLAVRPILEGPARVTRGTTMTFTVTLLNQSNTDIRLDPCPNYSEGFKTGTESIYAGAYRLNCAEVPSAVLPAGARIAFEMKVDVPTSIRPGEWMLFWHLKPDGVVGESRILVV